MRIHKDRSLFTSFSGVVYPGETLITEMWKEGGKVIFGEYKLFISVIYITISLFARSLVTKVKERGATVLTAAGATLSASGSGTPKAKL